MLDMHESTGYKFNGLMVPRLKSNPMIEGGQVAAAAAAADQEKARLDDAVVSGEMSC